MSPRLLSRALLTVSLGASLATSAHAGLVNGNFEQLLEPMPASRFIQTLATNVPGWMTSANDNKIEVWQGIGFSGQVPEAW